MGDSDADESQGDERELVARARVDADAFAEIYRRHVDRIHAFAFRRCGDVDLADDVTAVTFERALRGLGRFEPGPAGIAPWLFRIATNELTDHHRRRGRRRGDRARRAADRLHDPVAVDDLDRIDDADRLGVLRAGLDELNPRYHRVLVLRHLSGLDHEEAAEAMGLSPARMAVLVHRATAALRRVVERMEASR